MTALRLSSTAGCDPLTAGTDTGAVTKVADLDLTSRARAGDPQAIAELWDRHYGATLATARAVAPQPRDADELAADAFTGMVAALSSGAGPTTSVRAYLSTSVRRAMASRARSAGARDVLVGHQDELDHAAAGPFDPVSTAIELGLIREAFAILPARWRHVLWRTAVDHDSNIDVARELGITPNAVAALVRRARQGLRAAYLQMHLSRGAVDEQCRPFLHGLVGLLMGSPGRSGTAEHARTCAKCAERLDELRHLDRDLFNRGP